VVKQEGKIGFFKSLNGKIQLLFGGIFIVVIAGLGFGIFTSLSKGFRERYDEELEQTTALIMEITKTYVDATVRNYLIGLAEGVNRLVEYEYDRYLSGEISEAEAYERVKNIILDPEFGKIGDTGYLAGVNGKGILEIHPRSPGADASKYEFMQRATSMKEGYIEYMWKNPNDEQERSKAGGMAYFAPWDLIIWASSYKSEFHTLVDLDELEDRILSIQIGESGYAYIMDETGTMLIHPTMKGENLYDTQSASGRYFVREMIEQQNGTITYTMVDDARGGEAIVRYSHYPEMGLIVATKVYTEEIYSLITLIRNISIAVLVAALICANLLVALIISRIMKPISKMRQLTTEVAEGDLSNRIMVTSEDEISQISEQFNDLIDTIENILKRMKETSSEIFSAVQELSVSSQEITTTSNQQAAAVKEIVSTMEDSDQLSKSIAGRINEVTKISNNTKEVVENGFERVQTSLGKMEEIKTSNDDTITGIKSLGEKIESIWEIVNIINGIADQTKIIAFNAELEASAAGEAGKNFQIVAAEIRRLADSTVASTSEIKTKINEIQHSSDNLIIASEEGTSRINEGVDIAAELRKIFEDILSSSEISASSAEQIASSINQQVSAFEQILQTLKQISEGIDNFVTSTTATANSSSKLKEMAETMKEIVDAYEVREHDGK
jgi:methyl-accepting chemotaxis protein